jgi:hypothetical protein
MDLTKGMGRDCMKVVTPPPLIDVPRRVTSPYREPPHMLYADLHAPTSYLRKHTAKNLWIGLCSFRRAANWGPTS